MEMKVTAINYSFRILITQVGKMHETDKLLKELIGDSFGRQIAFSLRNLPYLIPVSFDKTSLLTTMAALESAGNKIFVVEKENISKTNGSIQVGESGEERTIYQTGHGFSFEFRKELKTDPFLPYKAELVKKN